MAKYTITHACGHTEEVALFGPGEQRRNRMAAMEKDDCAACRAKGSNLTGSVKQVAWAEDLRRRQMAKMVEAHKANLARIEASVEKMPEAVAARVDDLIADIQAVFDRIASRTSARDWIDSLADQDYSIDAARIMKAFIAANK